MALPELLDHYGYLALFVGCLLEGETLLLLAGYAAQRGLMWLPAVIAVAFVGGTVGDQVFFFLGRWRGGALLARWPALQRGERRVSALLMRHHAWLIVGVRFMYGLRIVGPIMIGNARVGAGRFLALNLIGAAVWAPLVAGLGYAFGETLQWMLADLARYEQLGAAVIVLIVALGALARWYVRRP